MQFSTVTKVLGALVALSGLVSCGTLPVALASRSATDLANNTTLDPMMWSVESKGKNITLYGDASSIIAQLKELDPDWVPINTDGALESRQTVVYSSNHLTCCPVGNWGWYSADGSDVNNAINQLGAFNGYFYVNPHSCSLASGYGTAGIWVCNDDNVQYQIVPAWMQNFAHEFGGCLSCGQMFSDDFSYLLNMIIHHV